MRATSGLTRLRSLLAAAAGIGAAVGARSEMHIPDVGALLVPKSRGKGRGTPSRRYGNPPGKYMPHQGPHEMARRRRQMGLE